MYKGNETRQPMAAGEVSFEGSKEAQETAVKNLVNDFFGSTGRACRFFSRLVANPDTVQG